MPYRALLVGALVLLLSGCVSGYKQFYQPTQGLTPEIVASRRPAPPPPVPAVERAQPTDSQVILDSYGKRGFVMIGHSSFNSGQPESEQSAVEQGKEVGADLVLILNPRYTGSVTSSVPITTPTTTTSYSSGTATAYGSRGPVTAYGSGTTTTYGTTTNYVPMTVHRMDYGAVYFVKQRFGLGVFVRDLNDSERQELQTNRGVAVRLVVDDTPAYNADVLAGDVITAIDNMPVSNAWTFNEALRGRGGQTVTLSLIRRGQPVVKSVRLNP